MYGDDDLEEIDLSAHHDEGGSSKRIRNAKKRMLNSARAKRHSKQGKRQTLRMMLTRDKTLRGK